MVIKYIFRQILFRTLHGMSIQSKVSQEMKDGKIVSIFVAESFSSRKRWMWDRCRLHGSIKSATYCSPCQPWWNDLDPLLKQSPQVDSCCS